MRMGDEAFSEAEKELLEGNPLIPTYGSMVPLSLSNSRSSKQLYRAMIKKEIQNDVPAKLSSSRAILLCFFLSSSHLYFLTPNSSSPSFIILILLLCIIIIVSCDGDAASSGEDAVTAYLPSFVGFCAQRYWRH